MKSFILIILIAVLGPSSLIAQRKSGKTYGRKAPVELSGERYKKWDEGELLWSDFRDTTCIKGVNSILKTDLWVEMEKRKSGNTRIYIPRAFAYIDRDRSNIKDAEKTQDLLRFYQAQFDLLELYRRKLQEELNEGMSELEMENTFRLYSQLYDEQLKNMTIETAKGQDKRKLEEWEIYLVKQLRAHPDPGIPVIEPKNFGYGLNLGVGTAFPTGEISKFFTPAFQFNLGLDLAYKRAHLLLDMAIGGAKNKSDMDIVYQKGTHTTTWEKGRGTNYSQFSFALGYGVLNTKYFALTPFVGGVFSEYSKLLDNDNDKRINVYMNDFNLLAGLNFDYKFSSLVSFVPSAWFGHREMTTSSLRTRLYVSYGRYDMYMKGVQVGFSVSYSGFVRLIKINNFAGR